jgi:predicted GIY-YIG superfamily endonuclease
MSIVYVLKLKYDKYYIGVTDDVMARYDQHVNGEGSQWTKSYPPVAILEKRPSTSPFDEEKVTKEYMLKYGIDNVRGAQYSRLDLTAYMIELERSIWHASGACLRCGRTTHFATDCKSKTTVTDRVLIAPATKPKTPRKSVKKIDSVKKTKTPLKTTTKQAVKRIMKLTGPGITRTTK